MKLLRVYMGEHDKYKGLSMYEYILKRCYELGIAGATVIKGCIGYGRKRHIHRDDFFNLSGDLPIIIEIIDSKEKIQEIRNEIEQLPFDGIIIAQDVDATIKENIK